MQRDGAICPDLVAGMKEEKCPRCGIDRPEAVMVTSPHMERRVCRGCVPAEQRAANHKIGRARAGMATVGTFVVEGEHVGMNEIQRRVGKFVKREQVKRWEKASGPLTWELLRREVTAKARSARRGEEAG